MSTLYAVPWYECNLSCPHCRVSKRDVKFDKEKFLESLNNSNFDNVILFGGEPTLSWKIFNEIVSTGKVNSVSTNLTRFSDDFTKKAFVPLIEKYNLAIATSWNLKRFDVSGNYTMERWLANVRVLSKADVDLLVLITLTEDLIESPMDLILYNFGLMEGAGVKKFLFEPYIGANECNEKADEWLCTFHDAYPGLMDNLIERKLTNWKCDCNEVFTLEPDGTIRKGCPDYIAMNELTFNDKCINCNYNDNCKPCMLQRSCSYPKKLAEKLWVM